MTEQDAHDIIDMVDRVPKRLAFSYKAPGIDEGKRGFVEILTDAGVETIRRWFERAGAPLVRIERRGNNRAYSCWFDWR